MYRHFTVSYILRSGDTVLKFDSEKDACEYLGVSQCTVSSCFRRNLKCKGFIIERGNPTTHCETKTRLHKIWSSMHERCERVKHPYFKHYGGRGIFVCEDWSEYENFREWALSNGYSDALTIDRIDNDGNYSPENCRWVSYKEQATNKRTNHIVDVDGEKMTLAECSEKFKIPKSTIRWRESNGRDILTGAKMHTDHIANGSKKVGGTDNDDSM